MSESGMDGGIHDKYGLYRAIYVGQYTCPDWLKLICQSKWSEVNSQHLRL